MMAWWWKAKKIGEEKKIERVSALDRHRGVGIDIQYRRVGTEKGLLLELPSLRQELKQLPSILDSPRVRLVPVNVGGQELPVGRDDYFELRVYLDNVPRGRLRKCYNHPPLGTAHGRKYKEQLIGWTCERPHDTGIYGRTMKTKEQAVLWVLHLIGVDDGEDADDVPVEWEGP